MCAFGMIVEAEDEKEAQIAVRYSITSRKEGIAFRRIHFQYNNFN